MAKEFDPYYQWFGIPSKDQPPNHYRLLGIELFEADRDVIDTAANRQMSFIKEYQAGKHSELTQRILNELSGARLCLLAPDKKAAYDEELRAVLEAREGLMRPPLLGRRLSPGETPEAATAQQEVDGVVPLRVPMAAPSATEPILPPVIEAPSPASSPGRPVPTRTPILADTAVPVAADLVEQFPQPRNKGLVFGLTIGLGCLALVALLALSAAWLIGPDEGAVGESLEVAKLGDSPSAGSMVAPLRDTAPSGPAAAVGGPVREGELIDEPRGRDPAGPMSPADASLAPSEASGIDPGPTSDSSAGAASSQNPFAPSPNPSAPASEIVAVEPASPPAIAEPREAQSPAGPSATPPQELPLLPAVAETIERAEQRLKDELSRASIGRAQDAVARQALRAVDQAIVDGQPAAAKRLATLAFAAARKSGSAGRAKDAALRLIELDQPVGEVEREDARRRLSQSHALPPVAPTAARADRREARSRGGVPDLEGQEASKKAAAEIYSTRFQQAKTPADKTALANEMVEAALGVPDGSTDQYTLLSVAVDVAAGAGDAVTALQTLEKIAERFDLQTLPLQAETVLKAAREATMTAQRKAVAEAAVSVIENLENGGDYDGAIRVCEAARSSAQRAREYALVKELVAKATELKGQQQESQGYREALTAMENSPTDPAANLAAGRYLCFVKGDWDRGIPMLVLGSEPELKAAAINDLRGTDSADEKASLADAWWDLAEKETETARDRMRERAAFWYEQALPSLSGLAKVKAEDRFAAVVSGGVKTNKAVTKVQDGRVGTHRALPSDLVNRGQPSLASIAIVNGQAIGNSSVNALNDGELYDKRGAVDIGVTLHPTDGTAVVFTLNTDFAPKGYDLAAIVSTTGSGGPGQARSRQNFTVEVAGVNSTRFVPVVQVGNLGSKIDESQVTTTGDNNQPLAGGVERVRVTFHNTDCECRESMYREFDIIGTPTP